MFARDPLQDGRQSDRALFVRRGVQRCLRALGYASLCELTLSSGRRVDVCGLHLDGRIAVVEVKSSLADLRADLKWREYRAHCDRLYFATSPDVPADAFPADAGLILADAYGADIAREAPEHRLTPAARRAVTLRFAHAAADKLHRLADPGACGLLL